ncbi:hypothetical protein DIPPA_29628 [Diplonema papillatum]|nr:hypothetical protein DIPPA_29628 [Diplonema papillatum]
MSVVANKLAAFSGKGVNMVQDLARTAREHTAILKPFLVQCGDALGNCYPDLYGDDDVVMQHGKFDLLHALETDTLRNQLDSPAVNGSLSTISQMTHFFLHMKHAGKGVDEAGGEFSGFSGDREGLLSAVAAASSASDAEFGSNAAKAIRAAFYAGLHPDKVAEEWNEKGISFSNLRLPCVSGETTKDLRDSKDLTRELADLMSKQYQVDWKKAVESTSSTEILAFGSDRPALAIFREAVESAGGRAEDWQLEAAGEGGVAWASIGLDSREKEATLLRVLRRLPCGASLPDELFITHRSPGDLLKAMKKSDAATAVDNRDAWQWGDVNWAMVTLFAVTHVLGIWGLFLSWNHPNFYTLWAMAFGLYMVTGVSFYYTSSFVRFNTFF